MTKSRSRLVSKFEPGLGLGGYGLDYITARYCCFFNVYGTVALRATADHYEKQHWSARNSYVPGVNNVQHRSTPLANHEMYRCHLCILNWALWRFLWKQWPNAIALALI